MYRLEKELGSIAALFHYKKKQPNSNLWVFRSLLYMYMFIDMLFCPRGLSNSNEKGDFENFEYYLEKALG